MNVIQKKAKTSRNRSPVNAPRMFVSPEPIKLKTRKIRRIRKLSNPVIVREDIQKLKLKEKLLKAYPVKHKHTPSAAAHSNLKMYKTWK